MAAESKTVKCRSCNRVLLRVSPTGLVVGEAFDNSSCDTCQELSALYDALQAADQEWEEALPKRDTNRGKIAAREKHRRAHMDFDNWLINVEEPTSRSGPGPGPPHDEGHKGEQPDPSGNMAAYQQGMKRPRSHSPTTSQHQTSKSTQETDPPLQYDVSLSIRPSPTRSISMTSLPQRKRLKFSDSVEFRDDYRDSSGYQRSGDTYVRGRYAPDEGSEYLDTSGSSQSFLKFTRMKKLGDRWVEVGETEAEKGNKYLGELRKLGISAGVSAQEDRLERTDRLVSHADTPQDARIQRRTLRTRGAPEINQSHTNDHVKGEVGVGTRRGRSQTRSLGELHRLSNETRLLALETQGRRKAQPLISDQTSERRRNLSTDLTLGHEVGSPQASQIADLVHVRGVDDRERVIVGRPRNYQYPNASHLQSTARMIDMSPPSEVARVELPAGTQPAGMQQEDLELAPDWKTTHVAQNNDEQERGDCRQTGNVELRDIKEHDTVPRETHSSESLSMAATRI